MIVFPNPATSVLNFILNIPDHQDAHLRFSTLTGTLVKQIRWGKGIQRMAVAVSNLKSGIYLYDLTVDHSKMVGRFIKE
ncbi:MAG: T9SS type A sorting domain-containing protein [Prolixibacteraceae bacterium]